MRKNKRAWLCLLYLLIPATVSAQIELSLSSGYGTYSMAEMKAYQLQLLRHLPVDAAATVSFPGYFYYELAGSHRWSDIFFSGASLTYGSTAGRIHYEDYSGELAVDQRLRYLALGFQTGLHLRSQSEKWGFQAIIAPAILFSKMDLGFESRIGSEREDEWIEFKSTNIGLQPSLKVTRAIGPLFLFAQAGYYLDLSKGKLFLGENQDHYLLNDEGDAVRAEWSGARLQVGICALLGGRSIK